jgi:hypothetical protein
MSSWFEQGVGDSPGRVCADKESFDEDPGAEDSADEDEREIAPRAYEGRDAVEILLAFGPSRELWRG